MMVVARMQLRVRNFKIPSWSVAALFYGISIVSLVWVFLGVNLGEMLQSMTGNYFVATGHEEVIIQNTSGTPYTITITSVPDNDGRSGDITTFSIPANTTYVWGPVQYEGWAQTNGQIYISAANAAILFGILT